MDRSTLLRNTSEEVTDLFPDFFFDLVFVDGPHTYKNVRNDIELFTQKAPQQEPARERTKEASDDLALRRWCFMIRI